MNSILTSKKAIEKGVHLYTDEGLRLMQWIPPFSHQAAKDGLSEVVLYQQRGAWYVMHGFEVNQVDPKLYPYVNAFVDKRLLWHVILRYVIKPTFENDLATYIGRYQPFSKKHPVAYLFIDGVQRKVEYIES